MEGATRQRRMLRHELLGMVVLSAALEAWSLSTSQTSYAASRVAAMRLRGDV